MMGMFWVAQYSSHKPHAATKYLNVASVTEKLNFI